MEKEMLIDLVNYFADKGYLVGGIKPRTDARLHDGEWVIEITPAPKQTKVNDREVQC